MLPKTSWSVLYDIRFWIIVFFVARLYGITYPPIEIGHNWRQATGHMIARNFYEVNNNILYPRLDMAGEKTGITGTEFPLLNYLEYLLSLIFGFHDWFGRLINLVVSSAGVYYFYLLIRKFFDQQLAFISALLLLTSAWLEFSRKAMPDTFSTSLVLAGLYYGVQYLYDRKNSVFPAYLLFTLAGLLSKIPAGVLMTVYLFPVLDRNIAQQRKYIFIAGTVVMLVPIAWWYLYWVPYLVQTYAFWHYYMGTSITSGAAEIVNLVADTLERYYFDALKISGFALYLFGIYHAIRNKEKKILAILLATSVIWLLFMCKAGRTFSLHSYYIVSFTPVMALVSAYGLVRVGNKNLRLFLLTFICVEGIANQVHDFYIKQEETHKLHLESIADKISARNDLVIINGTMNPQSLYFAHRKGWTVFNDELTDNGIREMNRKGARYLFIDRHELSDARFPYTICYADTDYIVYQLNP
jgi:4-amino-4-deoxy-L-arabinose transferase-like glycosyltransferase